MEVNESLNIIKKEVAHRYTDQNPGTSGLRKKVKHFQQEDYLENFVQSIFNSHSEEEYKGKSLVVGGDGRYYNIEAIQIIIRMAAANGIRKVIVGSNGIFSTPCVSLIVRKQPKDSCFGAIILSASHNAGGEHEDFGIKFNNNQGAPAVETVTKKIFENTKIIEFYLIADNAQNISLTQNSSFQIKNGNIFEVVIEDTNAAYVEEMQKLFDFDRIKQLFQRKDFTFCFDAMYGASATYAIEIFHKILGCDLKCLNNCENRIDFGGLHPDPNLVYAKNLVKIMDIKKERQDLENIPDFGAACDGDADRNMILGKQFFVSPSDSLAIIAANYKLIKSLRESGLKGVARSMPTSAALDRVAKELGLKCFETPTGWKFFGNLMDADHIQLCGEESFGTGSNHIREKDGIWAVLCWLSILAERNYNNEDPLISIQDITVEHWKTYGRNYYCRFDFENLTIDQSKKIMDNLAESFEFFNSLLSGNRAYVFEYEDIVDKSVSKNQGWIFAFENGSRIIFRVSGTSSTGATIRIYFEKYVDPSGELLEDVLDAISSSDNNLVELAYKLSNILEVSGMDKPSVIT